MNGNQRAQVLHLDRRFAGDVAEAEVDRPGDARGGLERLSDQREQCIGGFAPGDQVDRLTRCVQLDFLQSVADHVGDLVLDNLDQIVHVPGLACLVVNDESAADGQGRGHGGLVQPRLDFALASPGFRVSGAARRGHLTDHPVTSDTLLSLRGNPRRERLQPTEPRRNVMEEIGGEDFAAHDLIEAAGDLLVHGDSGGGLQDAARPASSESSPA